MSEERFVYYWKYDVSFGRRENYSERGYCIYTPKQIEDFKNSKLELCFEVVKYSEVNVEPSDINFTLICTEKEYNENELARKLCRLNDIIANFEPVQFLDSDSNDSD